MTSCDCFRCDLYFRELPIFQTVSAQVVEEEEKFSVHVYRDLPREVDGSLSCSGHVLFSIIGDGLNPMRTYLDYLVGMNIHQLFDAHQVTKVLTHSQLGICSKVSCRQIPERVHCHPRLLGGVSSNFFLWFFSPDFNVFEGILRCICGVWGRMRIF